MAQQSPQFSNGPNSGHNNGQNSGQPQRSNLEPELGGILRGDSERSGLEPELGGALRQRGVYVDEVTCIGCRHCAHVASHTFYIEPDYGRARVVRQDGDSEELVQEAIDTCPVNCIDWLDYRTLRRAEDERKDQVIPIAGFPIDRAMLAAKRRQKIAERRRQNL